MAWIAAVAAIGGGLLANSSAKKAARASQYRPWSTQMPGVGGASFANGQVNIRHDPAIQNQNWTMQQMQNNLLGQYAAGQQNALGSDFLRGEYDSANQATGMGLQGLAGASGLPQNQFFSNTNFQGQADLAGMLGNQSLMQGMGGYGGQNFLNAGQNLLQQGYQNQDFSQLRGNLMTNFNPNDAAASYTNLLRQQARPQEEQATANALTGLFGSGRLGTTGGANQMSGLAQAQEQADISRQVAGQQYGLQQQLMAQQGLDSALNAEQGRQLGAFGANQQGMMNQYGLAQGFAQTGSGLFGSAMQNAGMGMGLSQQGDAFGFDRQMGMNQMGWDRANQLYTASNTATQDRFNRAMQLFGGENAINQQYLSDFTGLLGAQQSNNQQAMDLARIGASVGQAQTASNANAAMIRNQGNQDMIAGFLGAANAYANRDK
jgi:hypothetical protein